MIAIARIGCWAGCLVFLAAGPAYSTTRYVNVSNAAPAPPYTSWETAAANIQAAIWQCTNGDDILVAPGVYDQSGGTLLIPNGMTLTLRSTVKHGAILDGGGIAQTLNVVGADSLVAGFVIRNGQNPSGGGADLGCPCTLQDCWVTGNRATIGAGIILRTNATVEACIVESNTASDAGGGIYVNGHQSQVLNCIIRGNVASNSGGGFYSTREGTASSCRISGNRAANGGGGVLCSNFTLVNSVVVGNEANHGGGISSSGAETAKAAIVNCTVASNTATIQAGGTYAIQAQAVNTIVYFNAAPIDSDLFSGAGSSFSNCCTPQALGGTNFTNAPAFVDFAGGDYHLATASFCIDAGLASAAPGDDCDGRLRPLVGTPGGAALPDVGAYEYAFHFNNIRIVASNTVDFLWDEQNAGIYALDASVPGLVNPLWVGMTAYTNPGMAAGQFMVHTQRLTITPPVPAHAAFRLRISLTP